MDPQQLLNRLGEIGQSLAERNQSLALIGLGSVGLERHRLDQYSDLDFFVIVEKGSKNNYLQDLSWLEQICPIAYCFQNTVDGYKLLFTDGIFCEFAIFEPDELATAAYSPGQIVWKREQVPDHWGHPNNAPVAPAARPQDWLVGEALTNLYVGMGREKRGEKLSAMRFIQWYAVDRLLELAEQIDTPQPAARDLFSNERRFEQRHPSIARQVANWMQGYEHNRESALAILAFLETNFPVNPAMAGKIRELCQSGT